MKEMVWFKKAETAVLLKVLDEFMQKSDVVTAVILHWLMSKMDLSQNNYNHANFAILWNAITWNGLLLPWDQYVIFFGDQYVIFFQDLKTIIKLHYLLVLRSFRKNQHKLQSIFSPMSPTFCPIQTTHLLSWKYYQTGPR